MCWVFTVLPAFWLQIYMHKKKRKKKKQNLDSIFPSSANSNRFLQSIVHICKSIPAWPSRAPRAGVGSSMSCFLISWPLISPLDDITVTARKNIIH